jgi:hypothetical protein
MGYVSVVQENGEGEKVPNNILRANYYFIYKKMVILHTTTLLPPGSICTVKELLKL